MDAIKGVASETFGIEPCQDLHENLKFRGHKTFTDVNSARKILMARVDVLISFGVIEHVENPIQYLQDIFDLLKPNGVCYLETDNLNDILNSIATGQATISTAFYTFCLLFITTGLAAASGAPGGLFYPMITLGAAIGLATGTLFETWTGHIPTTFIFAGMGGFVAG